MLVMTEGKNTAKDEELMHWFSMLRDLKLALEEGRDIPI